MIGSIQFNRSLLVTAGLSIGKDKEVKRSAEKKALEEKETLPND